MKKLLNDLKFHKIESFDFKKSTKDKIVNESEAGEEEIIIRKTTDSYTLKLQDLNLPEAKQFFNRVELHVETANDKLIIDTTNERFKNYMRQPNIETKFKCEEKDFKLTRNKDLVDSFNLELTLKEVIY